MAICTALALHKSLNEIKSNSEENKTTKKIGTALAAILVIGGLLALYALSASGVAGKGPLSGLGVNKNIAILGAFGGIEIITLLGLFAKKCGFGGKDVQDI